MTRILNLHFQSEYSFFESPTKIKNYVEFGKNNNAKSLVLTDHNNVHGFAEFRKYCNENNIKPIFGIDVDTNEGRLILLAKNFDGFSEIKRIAYIVSQNNFIGIEDIKSSNLFVINHPRFGSKNIDKLKSIFNEFYFYDPSDIMSNIYVKDTRILSHNFYSTLELINKLKDINLPIGDYSINLDENIEEKYINQINYIYENCNVVFPSKKNMLPIFSSNPLELLKSKIKKGINKLKDIREYDEITVKKRIEYELSILEKLQVENYFLIIADLIQWSRNNDISIGPGRGSVSGSLIAYVLGITQINPLKYNLYFERFLNEERISMPDIDIDIQDDRRDEVIEYLKNKYGFDNVAQICTFQRVGAKQALKDCGKFLNINFQNMNEITKLISGSDTLQESYDSNARFRSIIDGDELLTKLFESSKLIESLPRQIGIHAAGVVISSKPIIDSIPIMEIDGNKVCQFSMEHIEDWNLLKIDLLGLRTLTIIKKIEQEIIDNFDLNFSFENIPLNDEKTNKLLSSSKVLGIFQLESPGMMSTIKKVKITNFSDLVDTISLFRPGPLSNIPTYIENKNNPMLMKSISKEYDEIVKPTKGIIIYQEQIMEIIQKVAGLSFAKADILRRAISKKKLEDILEMEKLFISGATNNNVDENIAKKIYDQIVKFAEYGFNKSHAVAYATLSYKMAYLKTRFPLCFYAGLISTTSSIDVINKSVIEARELKFNIESPMINKISNTIVHNKKNTIYLPLTFIKGLGLAANQKIINEFNNRGPFKDFFDFVARAKSAKINDSIIDILIESNALREFGNMNTLINNKNKAFSYATVATYEDRKTNEIILDEGVEKPKLEIFKQDLKTESQNEVKYLGMIYNSFPTSRYESNDKLSNLKIGIEYKIVLYINDKREMMTKYNKMGYCVDVSDSTSKETIWFNKNMDVYEIISKETIGFATIMKLDKNGRVSWSINKWEEIKNYE